jgi:tryptophan 2,3-dioxygenase
MLLLYLIYLRNAIVNRATGETIEERVANLFNHPHASAVLKCMGAYEEFQTRFHQAHLGLAVQQLKIVGVDVGTGGTSFRDYLAKYNKEEAPLFPGLSASVT